MNLTPPQHKATLAISITFCVLLSAFIAYFATLGLQFKYPTIKLASTLIILAIIVLIYAGSAFTATTIKALKKSKGEPQ